jgi:hypothetical protein
MKNSTNTNMKFAIKIETCETWEQEDDLVMLETVCEKFLHEFKHLLSMVMRTKANLSFSNDYDIKRELLNELFNSDQIHETNHIQIQDKMVN